MFEIREQQNWHPEVTSRLGIVRTGSVVWAVEGGWTPPCFLLEYPSIHCRKLFLMWFLLTFLLLVWFRSPISLQSPKDIPRIQGSFHDTWWVSKQSIDEQFSKQCPKIPRVQNSIGCNVKCCSFCLHNFQIEARMLITKQWLPELYTERRCHNSVVLWLRRVNAWVGELWS